jgi:uncharacterized protein (TIGR02145 family)
MAIMRYFRVKSTGIALIATMCFLSSCDDSSSSSSNETPPPSDSVTAPVADEVKAPVFSPTGGTYTASQMVAVYSLHPTRTSIYYTTDGTTPTTSSTKFTIAITVSESKTLKAIAVDSTGKTSSVTTAAYTIPTLNTGAGTVTLAGQTYKTVTIGTQTWMAENLNYKGAGADTIGVCYNNSTDSCAKYGRLYKWSEVMAGKSSSSTSPSGVQGLCPTDWHVPSDTEWTILTKFVGESTAGTKLNSILGWRLPGTDAYGFKVLSAGYRTNSDNFSYSGNRSLMWSATESPYVTGSAWIRSFIDGKEYVSRSEFNGSNWISLRCLRN